MWVHLCTCVCRYIPQHTEPPFVIIRVSRLRKKGCFSLRVKQLSKHRLWPGDSMSNISSLCVVYHVNYSACGLELYFTRWGNSGMRSEPWTWSESLGLPLALHGSLDDAEKLLYRGARKSGKTMNGVHWNYNNTSVFKVILCSFKTISKYTLFLVVAAVLIGMLPLNAVFGFENLFDSRE